LLAEAQVFDLHQYRDGEAVIDRGIFDVLWRNTRFLERPWTGPDPGGISEIEILAAARSLHRFAVPDQPHQRLFQAFGDFRRGHDQRAAAVADHAAGQAMQRIGDHRRIEHFLDGDDLAQHRVRIVLRVMGGRDLDPGELLAGGAMLVHVAHGTHAVGVVGGCTISRFEIGLGARGAGRHRPGARFARQRDQRDRTFAGCNRFGGVAEMDQVRTTAGLGGIDVAHLKAEIIDHWPGAARSVAAAEIAVDIGLGQPGVFNRALGDFGMQLRGGFVGRMPGWVLVDPGDVGLALDAQYGAPLAFFLFQRFSDLSARPWQAPKYSVRRDWRHPEVRALARLEGWGLAPQPVILRGSPKPTALKRR